MIVSGAVCLDVIVSGADFLDVIVSGAVCLDVIVPGSDFLDVIVPGADFLDVIVYGSYFLDVMMLRRSAAVCLVGAASMGGKDEPSVGLGGKTGSSSSTNDRSQWCDTGKNAVRL